MEKKMIAAIEGVLDKYSWSGVYSEGIPSNPRIFKAEALDTEGKRRAFIHWMLKSRSGRRFTAKMDSMSIFEIDALSRYLQTGTFEEGIGESDNFTKRF